MTGAIALTLVCAYMAVLFAVAWRSDRFGERSTPAKRPFAPFIYGLSLAIYCTSWTYYGAVGTATRSGWEFLPIYLGPVIGIVVLFPIWRRIADAAKRDNAGSIADFLASRYGKSQGLGALVAVVATAGSLPYIALQLKSLANAWALLSGDSGSTSTSQFTIGLIAIALAGFAILFGARRPDLTEHNAGLIHAIALESIVKLAALIAVAAFAVVLLLGLPNLSSASAALGPLTDEPILNLRFMAITLLATCAIFCLPRQFHVAFVEAATPREVVRARWVFPIYLAITCLSVLPLVAAGRLFTTAENPDLFVLALPVIGGSDLLTGVVFVGGFSAATAMVIVEMVALSAMVSNSLVLPLLARGRLRNSDISPNMAAIILQVRRGSILVLMALAWLYFQTLDQASGLAQIGLTSFAALAQLGPALFGAVLWRTGHARGAAAGISAGTLVWLFMLALPQAGLTQTPFGLDDPLPIATFFSLSMNTALFILVSRWTKPRLIDRVQARAFVDRVSPDWHDRGRIKGGATVGDLKSLVARFVGERGAERAFVSHEAEMGTRLIDSRPAETGLARAAERMLAGAVGASSARRIIATALAEGGQAPEDVVQMLDEASEAVQFNRELLQTTLDNIDQGVSVVDADLRLTAWNARYLSLFELPANQIHVGLPIATVYRMNAERGEVTENVEAWVERRLDALRRRVPHSHERVQPNGRILRSVGNLMSGGGYVTSYTDITELRQAAAALQEANEMLEARVADRTLKLEAAKQLAEDATASKTRFLAAASHDVLQPLHAARLFIAALREEDGLASAKAQTLAENAEQSIESANGLLKALLNLSKLEAGGVSSSIQHFSAGELLTDLEREFAPVAEAKGLVLRVRPSALWIASDRDLLRSMMQNLMSNALRYTDKGGVLVGCRARNDSALFDVFDTGRGIPARQTQQIFEEFARLPGKPNDAQGAGLGLAIVKRLTQLLAHSLTLTSIEGQGSRFSVTVPRVEPVRLGMPTQVYPDAPSGKMGGLRVLCVDNDPPILKALAALLGRWDVSAVCAASYQEAIVANVSFDAALIDLHLGDGPDGLSLAEELRRRGTRQICLITADSDEALPERARAAEVVLLKKPVKPAALKAFLLSCAVAANQA